jgi:hypothetical protein
MEIWLDRKHYCSEKAAYLIKYVDLIGYIGIFGSALDTGNSISIHNRVSRYSGTWTLVLKEVLIRLVIG